MPKHTEGCTEPPARTRDRCRTLSIETITFKTPVVALLVILILIFHVGCGIRTAEQEEARPIAGRLYQLLQGRFSLIEEGSAIAPVPFQPWTVQSRVSDFSISEDRVYLGVNGHGIAELTFGEKSDPRFLYFYDSMIFGFRTITTLVPEDDGIVCHLYFNKLLNVKSDRDLKLQGISLLRLSPSKGIYEFLTPPFQEAHPEWEAVGFVPEEEDRFYLSWKYSDRNRVLFAYSKLDLNATREQEVDRLTFRESYNFRDLEREGSPVSLRALFEEARQRLDSPDYHTAYHLNLRRENHSLIQRYEYHPEGFTRSEKIRLFTLPVFRAQNHTLLLLPEGILLAVEDDTPRIERYRLSPLPEKTFYRDFLLMGEYLLASWEQPAFTDVAAAGIFIEKMPFFP